MPPDVDPSPPPPAPRRRAGYLPLVVVAVAALAAAAWRYHITRPDYRLAAGRAAVAARDWDAAAEYADRLAAAGRAEPAALLRAEALHAHGRPDLALNTLEPVRSDGPFKRPAGVLAGRCLLDLGNRKAAFEAFSGVLAEFPDDVDAIRGLATIHYDLGQTQQALARLQRVVELAPADPLPHHRIGRIHADAADLEPAEAAYRAALDRNPAPALRAEVRDELALNLSLQKKYPEALAEVEAAAAEAPGPESAGMAAIRAECYRAAGRPTEAAAVLDRAIAGRPDGGALYRIRGQVDLDLGRPADAVPRLEKAVALEPGYYEARYLLAQAYAGVGRQADADRELAAVEVTRRDHEKLTELTRQADARPWDPAVRLQLAEMADKIHKPELAAMWRAAAAALTGGR